jgi:hypothetical protein
MQQKNTMKVTNINANIRDEVTELRKAIINDVLGKSILLLQLKTQTAANVTTSRVISAIRPTVH